jgi:hypothetical protein
MKKKGRIKGVRGEGDVEKIIPVESEHLPSRRARATETAFARRI